MTVIAIPDADQTPEQFAGLAEGIEPNEQLARRLAARGFRVFVPALINRQVGKRGRRASLVARSFLAASLYTDLPLKWAATSLVMSCSKSWHWSTTSRLSRANSTIGLPLGEGGLLALTAAAVDTRIDLTFVDGYFGPREELWKEPIDRNLFGLLNEFGDAELAALIFPRELQIQFHAGPSVTLRTAGERRED